MARLTRTEARVLLYVRGRKRVSLHTALREASILFDDAPTQAVGDAVVALSERGVVDVFQHAGELWLVAHSIETERREPTRVAKVLSTRVSGGVLAAQVGALVLLGCAAGKPMERVPMARSPEVIPASQEAAPRPALSGQFGSRKQIRMPDGSLNFIACEGECGEPTPKTALNQVAEPSVNMAAADQGTDLWIASASAPEPSYRSVAVEDKAVHLAVAQPSTRAVTVRHRIALRGSQLTSEGERELAKAKQLAREATAVFIRSYAIGSGDVSSRRQVAAANASGLLARFKSESISGVVRANWCTDCAPSSAGAVGPTYAEVLVVLRVPERVAAGLQSPQEATPAELKAAIGCKS